MFSSQPSSRPQNQPEPSACLLTCIKSFVRRSWQPSFSSSRRPSLRRAGDSAGHDRSNALEWDWDLHPNPTRQNVERCQTHPSPKSNPGNNKISHTIHQRSPPAHQRRGRCGQKKIVSMADYLTLERLENVWQQQDTCWANQAAAMNNENPRAQTSSRAGDAADTKAALPPQLSSRDIHPAMRPGPPSRRD